MSETKLDHTTPTTCPVCGKVCKGKSGLGGHMVIHNRENGKPKPRKPYVRKPKPQEFTSMDICSTVLKAMFPSGLIPTNKVPALSKWVTATERFVEEMNGNH